MKIHDLHPSLRPREKAKEYGLNSLSDTELLALLIRTGTVNNSALSIAQSILNVCGGMGSFCTLKEKDLLEIKGISTTKAQQLLAIIELTMRINKPKIQEKVSLDSMAKVIKWLNLTIGYQAQESLLVLYLDHQNHFILHKILFTGTINQSNVYPRDIIREAYLANASRLILVHNHPSGSMTPSQADIEMTYGMIEALRVCELDLIDHLIVGKGDYVSLRKSHPYLFID